MSFGGSGAGRADGSVPFFRKHCEVGPSYWLSLQEAASASNKPAGARRSAVGGGTALQVGRSRVRFPRASLKFFIDIILPTAP